ncbi:BTA121 domain-containing protein surface lipoprotein [Borrelia turicatae]|uniref:Lipoprotein n=1 Tax=Borrelia turicatae (strain 91E135) TaxID=314724 RepID=A0A0R9PXP2_BORT9|nr:hypothetical protein [Borrelia turicatae]ALC78618.1 hypothetical protein BTA131 [Borrelia turicatae 91E135]UPA14054.1 hypothetical protein bt91E135_001220 [Borrelia turicatae 91E135]
MKKSNSVLLLLLVINCDFKSQGADPLKGVLVKKNSFVAKPLTTTHDFKSLIVKDPLVVQKPVVQDPLAVQKPVVQDPAERDVKKLIPEDVINSDSVAVVEEKSVDVEIDEFLNECGISVQDRESNVYLKVYLTNSDFDNNLFYTFITEIGSVKTKELLENWLKFCNLITEIKPMIENIKRERSKQQFISELDSEFNDSFIPEELKALFDDEDIDSSIEMYGSLRRSYDSILKDLREVKDRVAYVIKGEAIYAGLIGQAKQEIDDIRKLAVVSDVSDGIYDGSGYNDHQFYSVLGAFGVSKLKRLSEVNLHELIRVRKEAEDIIKDVENDLFVKVLETKFDEHNKFAVYILQNAFSMNSDYVVKDKIIDSRNSIVDGFMKVTGKARSLINFRKMYANLSSSDAKIIIDLRNILTDSRIGSKDKDGVSFKTYTYDEFEYLLGGLNEDQVGKMIVKIRKALELQNDILQMIDSIKDDKSRDQVKIDFLNQKEHYKFLLKTNFNCLDINSNDIYSIFMSFKDNEDGFKAIKSRILKLV